ncbi:MAG: exodeoxyribonuclease V subunit gamma [Gammaproteobacteria bacterium]|nr:exodeoxyribonuclease V subunit gamma [Gammaproteobacteria bacterium]MDP2140505.1 exodeoxyribonuclease V subunit gamma [Gammaproteobacteria bacterium]MDP2348814.1 exodeoxyribonuclease V subunit gamma [Gammaproteobacteria bacterium]
MSFHLNCSNRIESLQQLLALNLVQKPLESPLASELILVPGMAMQRWLNLQLASQHGVATNIEYPLPATWFWKLAASALEGGDEKRQDPLSRELAAWKIYGTLPALLSQTAFQPLSHYLHDDATGVKRWQLAQRIADVFDRYQYYRPEWIRAWSSAAPLVDKSAQDIPDWQPLLWRELVRTCEEHHRVAVIDRLLTLLRAGTLPAQLLPERISCFALSSLPPLFVEILKALACYTEIHLFQHSPTDQYWADLRSKKSLARMRVEKPNQADYYDTGNELLASWGRQGQAFQDLLLSNDLLETAQWEDYREPGDDTLLHRLQQDILSLNDSVEAVAIDESLQVNICHSALRECQVLHDQLLRELEKSPDLKPEDILVIVPEISRYAPFIEAVFRRDENGVRPFIPWNLSDTSVADEHPLIRTFLQLLALPGLRFTSSEVLSFLGVPEIARHFGLDDSAQEDVIGLLQESQVRWGIDGAHKKEWDLPPTEQNTWRHAADRLLAGYALGEVEYWNGIAPLSGVSGGRAAALGRFFTLLDTLCRWREQLRYERSAQQWQVALNAMLQEIFGTPVDDDDKLQQIREVIGELKDQAVDQMLSPDLVRLWLEECLGTRTAHNRFFSGGVTFCGMRPMRSLPFRIICALGMNDLAFPRRENAVTFDAMAQQWHSGDPRKGDEDRYLLLETLLCARDKFYFSYTGRSLKDNTPCQPSVLLQEFMDFVDARYIGTDDPKTAVSKRVTTLQPMQAFSPRNFVATDKAVHSYDSWWCRVAQSLVNGRKLSRENLRQEKWPAWKLPAKEELMHIELSHLIRFLQHPVKYFFNSRLRIRLKEEVQGEDDEVFSLDGLQSWNIRNEMIAKMLQETDETSEIELQTVLSAQGLLPHGGLAESAYAQVRLNAQRLLDDLAPYRGMQPITHRVDLTLGVESAPVHLSGRLESYLPGVGILHYTPSAYKGKYVLAAWMEHLALCAVNGLPQGECTALYCRDGQLRFEPFAAEQAREQLSLYLELYREGIERPLPVFPDASFALAKAEDDKALKAAWKCWASDDFRNISGDRDDAYVHMVLGSTHVDPLGSDECKALADAVYGPALRAGVTP